MNDNIPYLRLIVADLQIAYDKILIDLRKQGFSEPALVKDTKGHYILLDTLTALVQANTALVNARKDEEEVKDFFNYDSWGMPFTGPELVRLHIYVDPETGLIEGLPEEVAREKKWILADGRALSRSEYPKLYEVFQETGFKFGQDEAGGTFNIPNFLNRVVNKEQ